MYVKKCYNNWVIEGQRNTALCSNALLIFIDITVRLYYSSLYIN